MISRVSLLLLAVLYPLLAHGQEPSVAEKVSEERMITFVKGIPAKEFDSSLPKMRLERWLMDVAGNGLPLRWELNDCGEQTGDPATDKKRDIPVCVEAAADLPNQRAFSVQIQVGTFGGKAQKPALRGIYFQFGSKLYEIKKLSDLPKQLKLDKPA